MIILYTIIVIIWIYLAIKAGKEIIITFINFWRNYSPEKDKELNELAENGLKEFNK